MMRLIHRCHGRQCWRRLHLRSHDNGAKEDGRGDRTGNVDIRSWEEVGHYNLICPCGIEQRWHMRAGGGQ